MECLVISVEHKCNFSCYEHFRRTILKHIPATTRWVVSVGCAVVATDCGGRRNIIVDGEDGFLVEVGNVEQIVSSPDLLLDDLELRRQFVHKSRETVRKFSWESSVDKLEKVLCSLIEAH